ncbi:macrophage mannose receptor 1-like [Branchiostoma floridae x Branchiostoma belcheri]
MMTFQARYRGVLLLLAVGGTAILQSAAAPEKRDLSVAEKVESFVERLEELIDGQDDEDKDNTMDMMEKNGIQTEEIGDDSWLPQTRQAGCSSGYQMRAGVCYKAFNTPKNFHDASSTCVADGGTLAMPKDAGTNAFLLYLKNAVHRAGFFWFGLVDHHQEGGWEWIDGTPLRYRAWGPGEPNNAGNEDCAEYFPAAWNDAPCSRTDRKFICQKVLAGCPSGYVYHHLPRLCYKAFNEKRTYDGAVAKCSADGGTLAMPRGPIINKFLIYLKNAVDKTGWFRFGLTDRRQEGDWRWANNLPLSGFRAWAPGQPNNWRNQDCAEYFPESSAKFNSVKNRWGDGPCTTADRKFICQVSPGSKCHFPFTYKGKTYNSCTRVDHSRPWCSLTAVYQGKWKNCAEPPVVPPVLPPVVTCRAGYQPFRQNCFKAFDQIKPDYTWAMKACMAEGGRLAMPKDAATNAFLVRLKNAVRNSAAFYIGLSDQNAEGQWRFADGTAIGSYNNWNPGEPNNAGNEDCATLLPGYGGKWNDLPCSSDQRYICQVPPIHRPQPPVVPPVVQVTCRAGYQAFHQNCFKAFDQIKPDYTWAMKACMAEGGRLAMPKDAATNTFLVRLKNAVRNSVAFYIGLSDQNAEGQWRFADGTAIGSYNNWNPGEPNNAGNEDCATLLPGYGGKWNDLPCSSDQRYICQVPPIHRPQPPVVPPVVQVTCRAGYQRFQQNCFKAFDQIKPDYTWAMKACMAEGGRLAMPKDAGTQAFLNQLKNAVRNSVAFYIGLSDQNAEGQWRFADGTAIGSYNNWNPGEPNNAGNEDCATLLPGYGGKWNDLPCSSDQRYICQVPPIHRPQPPVVPPVVQVTCRAGYQRFQQNCFKAFDQIKPDYTWAMKACMAEGGRLAMPKDAGTQAFLNQLKNAVRNNADFYIGLNDQNAEGQWRFADGTALGSYNNWNPGEPNNSGNEDCVALLPGYGSKWNDIPCNLHLRYICQVPPIRSGSGCHFPFTYKGKTYNSCTRVDHSRPWCSLTAVYQGKWKNCAAKREMPDTGEPEQQEPEQEELYPEEPEPQEPEPEEAGPQESEVGEANEVREEDMLEEALEMLENEVRAEEENLDPGEPDPEEPEPQEPEPEEPEPGEANEVREEDMLEEALEMLENEVRAEEENLDPGEPDPEEPEPQEPEPEEPDPEEPEPEEPEPEEAGPQEPEVGEANEVREEDMLEEALEMLENEVRAEEENLEYGLEE